MTAAQERIGTETARDHVLVRLRTWWRRRSELDRIDRKDLERIADDVGVTVGELKDLVARGPHAADLLYERMHALGIDKEDVEAVMPHMIRDLERTCCHCPDKGVCERDLLERPGDPAWHAYCPNAASLTCVKVAKGQLSAQPQ